MIADLPPEPSVVVTAPRLPDAIGNAAYSVVQVDPAQLKDATDLDAALKSVAGFSLYRRTSTLGANPTTQGVSLRAIAGSGASRALVTLDGVPQNDPFGGWVIWTALPPQTLGGASIVRGAGAGPYGAGALTGVVALTSRAELNGTEGEVSAGSLGYREGLIAVGGDMGGAKVLADLGAQHSDGWIPVIQGRGAADRPLSLDDYNGAVRVEEQVGKIAVAERVSAYDENRGAGLVNSSSRAKGAQASITAAAQPTSSELGWRLQGWVSVSDLYNSTGANSNMRNTSTPSNIQYATPALGWGVSADVRKLLGDTTSIDVGADVRGATGESRERATYTSGVFTKSRKAGGETLVAGLYVEGSTEIAGWLLTGGVRADEWMEYDGERVEANLQTGVVSLNNRPADKNGVLPTGRIGMRRELVAGFAWRSAAYAGFRPATLNELHRPFRVGNNITESNPDLNPEKLYGAETGLDYHSGGTKASATLFYNQLKDAITNVTVGHGPATFPIAGFVPAGGTLFQRENAGTINATGLEAEAEQRVWQGISLTSSLAWTYSKVDGGTQDPQLTSRRPALTPRLTATAGARWTVIAPLDLSVDAKYESARYDDDLNTLRLRSGVTADVRADWKIRPGLGAYLAIDNLFDAKIQTAETADFIYSYDAPRIVRVGLRFAL